MNYSAYAASPLLVHFTGGNSGLWRITRIDSVRGQGLAHAERLDVVEAQEVSQPVEGWTLTGFTSNIRYTVRDEIETLAKTQAALRREDAKRAALIPISKSAAWWALSQDERRTIFEEQSHHIRIGLDYLPAIARRLHHSRDLGQQFDFLTWFEFAPQHEGAFDDMLVRLRSSPEWTFVEREVDIRLTRD